MPYPNRLGVPAHYSGGFWWSKSDFIKKLPNPQIFLNSNNVDRFNAEFWLGRIYHKALCLYEIPKYVENGYSQHRAFIYTDKSIYENNLIKNTYINKI